MNLYEIDVRIMEAFEAAVDEETGEIVNEDKDRKRVFVWQGGTNE